MLSSMKSAVCKPFLLFILLCAATIPGIAQGDQPSGSRKVVARVAPAYPSLAKTLNLSGTVRLEALVMPNGSVKTVQIKGGNPLLAQAAENAVRGWKWEKLDRDTTETLEIHFTP